MNKPYYPEIEFAMTVESWENVFIDKEGNEMAYEYPTYFPPKLHWRTFQGKQQHYGWFDLDLQQVINDSQDDIINAHKHQIMMELRKRFGF